MAEEQIRTVDAETVKGWLAAEQVVVVDVREVHEHAAAHIPGAILNPLSCFDPAKVPAAAGKHVVVHCAGGVRCGPASRALAESGYAGDINRMKGGIMAWMEAGGPVAFG